MMLAHHGFSERRTSQEIMVRCVSGELYPRSGLARYLQGRYAGVSQPVVIRAPLIPPHFFNRRTLAVVSFIDIVRQNWPGNARLRKPLQRTVIQRGLPPRWPQLSDIAWVSDKRQRFLRGEEAFLGNTAKYGCSESLNAYRFFFIHEVYLCLKANLNICVRPSGGRLCPQHIAKDCCCG